MGIIYYSVCDTCKKYRNIDKFNWNHPVKTRAEAIKAADEIAKDGGIRAALLCSFMAEHRGHVVRYFDDAHNLDELCDRWDSGYSEDYPGIWDENYKASDEK